MTKTTVKMVLAAAATFMLASNANAGPLVLSNAQLDSVAAAGAPSPTGFVCPVIGTDAVLNAKNGIEINGAYSILGPAVSVPVGATNGEGAGSPGGTFASPGDAGYTAIWNTAG
ncbi:MAG: hypothetical protein HOM25_22280 [Rhodospirillaceae bacterium]|nr:hypothetical protein [Rhodospirillaceae bacterium]MBT5663828.1 hypothetical protein [Rhodospirillaceae bacterium]MBT5810063.1 hypothetical protein [Rhodospirillaceae bacterium]